MKTISRSLTRLGTALRAFETQSFSFGAGNRTQEKGPRHNKSFTLTFKAFSKIAAAVVLTLCSTLALAQTFFADDASQENEPPIHLLLVDDDHIECPGATFETIQSAVNLAAPGDVIQVCPGTYDEQVEIAKRLTLEGIERNGKKASIVQPSNMIANSMAVSPFFGGGSVPVATAILVHDTSDVTIKNIIVDGTDNGIGVCEPVLLGIYYQNASGVIDSVTVRNIKLGTGLEECPTGLGIYTESSGTGRSRLTVTNSSIHDCQLTAWRHGNQEPLFGP